jgi:hypothetical protein
MHVTRLVTCVLLACVCSACTEEGAETAVPVSATETQAAQSELVEICVGCDPTTTQDGYIATLSDQALFPALSPQGAALARSMMSLNDADATRLLAAATRDFDCSFAVTDDSYDQFAGWAGLHAARSSGFSPSDASLIASDLGLGIMNSADWDQADLILDQDQALIGVGKCL